MKINFLINLNTCQNFHSSLAKQKNIKYANTQEQLPCPNTEQFLSFRGGYSINLAQTYDHIEFYEYPPDIELMVKNELEINNPDNKTLSDIHFEKYEGVLDCFSLEELKEKYPEFKDIKSSYDITASENSFIGKFQRGLSEVFPNNEDLTLQLIKLYWGHGFSLNDISKYLEQNSSDNKGFSFINVMNKLNIPLMNKHYAAVLKLSDKDYNEKYTSQMAIKLKEAKEEKQQLREGEPVYIPSGNISEERNAHISASLEKYYREHPEECYKISKRQKEFYAKHPEFSFRKSFALSYAWNSTQEGRTVKKALTKFLNKYYKNIKIDEDELSSKREMNNEQRDALDLFWDKNKWATIQFSIAAKKGWDYIKNNPELVEQMELNTSREFEKSLMQINTISTQLQEKIRAYAVKKGYPINNLLIGKLLITPPNRISDEFVKRQTVYVQKIIDEYFKDNPIESIKDASARQIAIRDMFKDLLFNYQNIRPKISKEDAFNLAREIYAINENLYRIFEKDQNGMLKPIVVDGNIVFNFYAEIIKYAVNAKIENFQQYSEAMLDNSYKLAELKARELNYT